MSLHIRHHLDRSRVTGLLLVVGAAATAFAIGASAGSPPPTVGPIPESAFQAGQPLVSSLVPDFIPASDRAGNIAGYVAKKDLDDNSLSNVPVYATDLKTVVGYMVPDKGFVPLGQDPDTVQAFPVVAGPSPAR